MDRPLDKQTVDNICIANGLRNAKELGAASIRQFVSVVKDIEAKTGVEYITVVGDEAMEILERYNYDISITNQVYNRYLKIVALQAGITKKLHSHLLRHTFAHHQLNEKHLNIATVSKMLGHTNLKQTMHYCQKHTNTILEEFVIANQG